MNPLISVIVPVYNVEKYLDRCIDSIVNQTYKNLEIILVNDGSPDNSGAICDEWAKADSRIKIIYKENGGLSDARNAGTDCASGEYITYVDSDDYILPEYIEYLYNNLIKTHADVSCCCFQKVYSEDKTTTFETEVTSEDIQIISGREACFKLFDNFSGVHYVITPCKLYPKHIVKKYKFPKGMLHEDEATTYKIFFDSEKICFGSKKLYAYFQNDSGITHNKTEKNYRDLFQIFKSRAEFFQTNSDKELEKTTWNFMISFLIYSHVDFKKRFGRETMFFTAKHWLNRDLSRKSKFKFLLYLVSPKLYLKAIDIVSKE